MFLIPCLYILKKEDFCVNKYKKKMYFDAIKKWPNFTQILTNIGGICIMKACL